MAYVCETVQNNVCTVWIELDDHGFLPSITAADRDQLLLWFISVFVVVFTLKSIRKLMGI